MMNAIQCLLHRQAAVLYAGHKLRKILLFLSTENGNYRVWSGSTDKFGESRFILEPRVVAITDPREEGPYSSMGECRVLKFVSNNVENISAIGKRAKFFSSRLCLQRKRCSL
eukprot:GFKZ01000240.1.p3 GENE.GFKZ01000240.1~~GFKZ01000240.1.p3  ORF type:complete len:112 (+),score=10.85 GFKZ01000240.1:112-447(+)